MIPLIREGRADDRSIPAIIANTKPSGLEYVLEVANIDMERNRQLRLKGKKSNDAQSYQSTTTSASATPSVYMGNASVATSSTSIPSPGGHHKDIDELLTNTVPGFNYLGQNPISDPTSYHPSPAGGSTWNDSAPVWQETTEVGGSGDKSLWELINGGAVDDLDFSAFLQNFNDDGSAI